MKRSLVAILLGFVTIAILWVGLVAAIYLAPRQMFVDWFLDGLVRPQSSTVVGFLVEDLRMLMLLSASCAALMTFVWSLAWFVRGGAAKVDLPGQAAGYWVTWLSYGAVGAALAIIAGVYFHFFNSAHSALRPDMRFALTAAVLAFFWVIYWIVTAAFTPALISPAVPGGRLFAFLRR